MQNLQCYMAFHHYLNSKFWTVSFLEHFLVYKQHELHKLNAAEAQAWGRLGARPQTPTLLSAAGASTLPVPLLAQLLQTHGPNGRSSSPHLLPKKTQERQTTTQQQNSSPNRHGVTNKPVLSITWLMSSTPNQLLRPTQQQKSCWTVQTCAW